MKKLVLGSNRVKYLWQVFYIRPNFGKMILTPLIDIDNLNLSKIEPSWSLMTKGDKLHKDSEKMKDDKGGEL